MPKQKIKELMPIIYDGMIEGIEYWQILHARQKPTQVVSKNEQFFSSFISKSLNIKLYEEKNFVTHETHDHVLSAALDYTGRLPNIYDLVLWNQAGKGRIDPYAIIEVKTPNKANFTPLKDAIKIAELLSQVPELKVGFLAYLVRDENLHQGMKRSCEKITEVFADNKSRKIKKLKVRPFLLNNDETQKTTKSTVNAGIISISVK